MIILPNFAARPRSGALAAAETLLRTYHFSASRYTNGAAFSDIVCTRAAPATSYHADTSGGWIAFAANQPRITDRGLLVEAAATNLIRNNSWQGAVVGTPGTIPTDHSYILNAGLARQVVGLGTENGLDYMDLRVFGTLDASSALHAIEFDNGVSCLFPTGTTGVMSCLIARIAGTFANVSGFAVGLRWYSNGVGGAGVAGSALESMIDAEMRRYHFSATAPASVTHARPRLRFSTGASGQVVDFTIRIWAPQLEVTSLGAPSSPIRTVDSAVTRDPDDVKIALGSWYSQSAGTIIARGSPSYSPIGSSLGVIVSLDDGTANNRIQLRRDNAGGGRASAIVLKDNVAQALLTAADGSWNGINQHSMVWAYAAAGASFCENGGSVLTDADAEIPTVTQLRLGAGPNGIPLNGTIELFAYLGNRRPDGELPALSRFEVPRLPVDVEIAIPFGVSVMPLLRDPAAPVVEASSDIAMPFVMTAVPILRQPVVTGYPYTIPYQNYTPSSFIFMSPQGSDTTGTGSILNPYLTLAKCLSAWMPGAAIIVRGQHILPSLVGQHRAHFVLPSGQQNAPLLIKHHDPDGLHSGGFTSLGTNVPNGIFTCSKQRFIKIQGLLLNCSPWGVTYRGVQCTSASGPYSRHIVVTECKIHGFAEDGIKFSQCQGGMYVTHNRIWDTGEDPFDALACVPFLSDIDIPGAGGIVAHNEFFHVGYHNGEGAANGMQCKGGNYRWLIVHNIIRDIRDQPSFSGDPTPLSTGSTGWVTRSGSPFIPGWGNGAPGGPDELYYESAFTVARFNRLYDAYSTCTYWAGTRNGEISDNILDRAGNGAVIANWTGGIGWPTTPRSVNTIVSRNRCVQPFSSIAISGSGCSHVLGTGTDANIPYPSLAAALADWPYEAGPHWGVIG